MSNNWTIISNDVRFVINVKRGKLWIMIEKRKKTGLNANVIENDRYNPQCHAH